MSTRSRRRLHRLRIRWGFEVVIAVVLVIAAIICLAMVRADTLDTQPWAYIAVAVAILAAVGAMLFTITEAYAEEKVDDDSTADESDDEGPE